MAASVLVAPASAQGGMNASGSCGYREGQYGIMGLFPDEVQILTVHHGARLLGHRDEP